MKQSSTLSAKFDCQVAHQNVSVSVTAHDYESDLYSFQKIKEALSVLILCAPVFIFTSGSSALLGCPHCGLSI